MGGAAMLIPGGPRFVIVGIDLTEAWAPKAWANGYRVMLIASSELTRGEIEAKADPPRFDPFVPWVLRREDPLHYFLTAEMKRFVMTYGTSYADAIRKIMGEWNPDEPQGQLHADHYASPAEEAEFRALGPGQL